MFGLHPLDLAVIVVYLVGIAAVGIYVARRVKDTSHYFLGGRGFGKLLMIGQAFGVGTHAEQPVAVAGKCFSSGLSGIWYQWKFIFCTPFYWIIAPIFRRLRFVTSAEYMEARYGAGVGVLYTAFALMFFTMNQSGMLLGAAKVVDKATGGEVSKDFVIYSMTVIFIVYSFFGGLISSAVTDFLQSFLIIVLSVMLLPAGLSKIGGFTGMRRSLPESTFDLSTPGDITAWVIVALSVHSFLSTFAQPHHMAVAGTGKTETNCRIGFTYGNFVKRFCTLGWALVGLIVAAMVLQGHVAALKDPEEAFGLACQTLLTPGFVGLMIACVLAANMSTCSAFMVDTGALFVQNIYRRYLRPGESDAHYLWIGRVSGLIVSVGAIGLAKATDAVLQTILISETLAAFMGVPFVVGLFWRRANRLGACLSFGVATAVFFGLDWHWYHGVKWQWDAFLVGTGAGITTMVLASLLSRPEPAEAWNGIQERLHLPASAEPEPETVRAARAAEAEAAGEGLLIVDLLQLHRTFSFRRYRKDVMGFAAAWGVVAFLILCAMAIRWM